MINIVTDAGNGNKNPLPTVAGHPRNPLAKLASISFRRCLLDRSDGWPKIYRDCLKAQGHAAPYEIQFLTEVTELCVNGRPIPSAEAAKFEALSSRIILGRIGGVQ